MDPNLGKPVAEFKRSRASFTKVLVVSLICLLISAFIFSGAFAKNAGLDQKIVLSILALVFMIPPVFGFYMLFTRRGSSVTLHENGLVYRMGSKVFATTWDDVASVTQTTASRIEKKNGEAFDLGQNVEGYAEIELKLREETLSRMLPQAKSEIERGRTVSFPGFILDSRGIQLEKDGTKLAWPQVEDFGVRQGEGNLARFEYFYIQGPEHEFEVNYGVLPNAHLLLALCEGMTPHLQGSSKNAEELH